MRLLLSVRSLMRTSSPGLELVHPRSSNRTSSSLHHDHGHLLSSQGAIHTGHQLFTADQMKFLAVADLRKLRKLLNRLRTYLSSHKPLDHRRLPPRTRWSRICTV